MHKLLLALSLFATLVVACITVHVQTRARVLAYELGRARTAILELDEACDAVRACVVRRWSPERVIAAAERLREERRRAVTGEPAEL